MSLDKLIDSTKLDNSLTATASAIRAKTGVSDSINFDFIGETGFASAIDAIPVGPTPAPAVMPKDVNFWDYDGTLLYSYSKADFLQLTEMPANPSHDRLIAQGWNWTLSDAKDYVTNNYFMNIGQLYTTVSGGTEIDVMLNEDTGLSPCLGLAVKGTVVINWGDGNTSTLTGTTTGSIIYTDPHNYVQSGFYTITVIPQNDAIYAIRGANSYGSQLLYSAESLTVLRRYRAGINAIYCGPGCQFTGNYGCDDCCNLKTFSVTDTFYSVGQYGFRGCSNLKSFTLGTGTTIYRYAFSECSTLFVVCLPKTISTLEIRIFSECNRLTYVTLPTKASTIDNYTFAYCSGLFKITVPSQFSSLGNNAFYTCTRMRAYYFKRDTPPSLYATTFSYIPADCIIYVPKSENHTVLDSYKAAQNWSTYASQIFEEP